MKENPSPSKMWGGQTYKYWAHAADETLLSILDLPMPIYYMMGTKDEFYTFGQDFMQMADDRGKDTIIYVSYHGLPHDYGSSF